MAETWPVSVRSIPKVGSLKLSPFREPLVTDMDGGKRRQRRQVSKRIAIQSFSLLMTNAEFAVFSPWVENDLVSGTLPFTADVWRNGLVVSRTCTFRKPYEASSANGLTYSVQVEIDVEDL